MGLDFSIHCESNAAGNDISNRTSSTLQSCIDACALSLPGQSFGACRAVSYNVNTKRCFLKNGYVTTSNLSFANETVTAIADSKPFEPDPGSSPCPSGNDTIHTDDNGMEYNVLCDLYWSGNNYDPGEPGESAYQPFHADTLTDCMNFCSENGPLCYGVRWRHSAHEYYRNCWPKKANITHSSSKLEPHEYTVAAVGRLQVNSTCIGSSENFTASNQAVFEQSCDTSGDGPDIENVHTKDYEECMDRCAIYESNDGGNTQCGGILYQPNAERGFRNCYLKHALSNVTSQVNWHMAMLVATGSQTPPTNAVEAGSDGQPEGGRPESNSEGGSETKTWIAGAVAGPVLVIAAIGGLLFWWRRHKAPKGTRTSSSGAQKPDSIRPGLINNSSPTPDYYWGQTGQTPDIKYKYDHSAAELPPTTLQHHISPSHAVELPSVGRDAKELSGTEKVRHELQ